MFTGLIEQICTVKAVRSSGTGLRLTVGLNELAEDARCGDSIAVNGVCLTISGLEGKDAVFDVSGRTVKTTALGSIKPGRKVNTERALKPSQRLGGHFVSGHIDGTAAVSSIDIQGDFWNVEFTCSTQLLEQMIEKGSVAVDGVSLTIAGTDRKGFETALIPETVNRTTLQYAEKGTIVNIETDIIVKTIKKQLEAILPQKEPLTIEKLKQMGF